MYSTDLNLVYVQKRLVQGFNLDELKMLCMMLDINHENIRGDTLNSKTRELVIHCHRHGLLPKLLEESKALNQSIDWSEAYRTSSRPGDLPAEWVEPMQQLYRMAKEFNRNRALPFSDERTRVGDDIAFRMREVAPYVFGEFDVGEWLHSTSIGKRLAAVKYLDWAQDVDHFAALLPMLVQERGFIQFHVLLTLDGMLDQLDLAQRALLQQSMLEYTGGEGDGDRAFWRDRILRRLEGGDALPTASSPRT